MLLNCISKLQGLLCLVPNDWIQYFTSKVCNEPFHLQGASPIKPTASLQISEFYNLFHVFQLKLLAAPVPLASHFSLKQSWLGLNWFAFVAIFHRKMIPKGQLLLLQSVDIFKFDCENATSSLNSICILLAIAVCVNRGSVVVTKRMLKWRDLPLKHDTNRFLDLALATKLGYNFESASVVVLDRFWKPTDAHVRGTMLGLVNGIICTKVKNGEYFHNSFDVLISLLQDPCWVKFEIARIVVFLHSCNFLDTSESSFK